MGRVVPGRRTIVRHDERRARMVLNEFCPIGSPQTMSIIERPALPPPPAAGSSPRIDRLRVVTAGNVGNIDARLGTSGFDVVAVAQTEYALIDAVSADEPDAIVVDADLCESLEHVRDLAPDAVLIVVGDHTPAGALGRIEDGVSGTVMAGLLHALIAEGVGAAAVWGLVPAFQSGAALQVHQPVVGSLLYAKADLLRAYLVNVLNAFRDHAELVTAASTVAVTVSAGVLLTMTGPRTDGGPARVPVPPHAVERTSQERAPLHAVFVGTPTTSTPSFGSFGAGGEPGARGEQYHGDSRNHGRHDGPVVVQGSGDHGKGGDPPGLNGDIQGLNDDIQGQNDDDQGQNGDPHGQNGDPHGQNPGPHGQNPGPHGQNPGPHGQNGDPHGQNEGDSGVTQNQDDQGENEDGEADQGKNDGVVSAA